MRHFGLPWCAKCDRIFWNSTNLDRKGESSMRGPYSQLKSIPNILSLVRILLIPFFLWAFLWKRSYLLSSGLLIFSGLTDLCDGYIARRFNMVTELGKVLDPVADKLTQLAILFCLSLRYPVFLAALAAMCIRDRNR